MTPQLLPFFSSQDPFENLSREELIFETFDPAQALLLLYINTASVVIGKNQNPWREARLGILEQDGIPMVRRITGGGTVWHDEGNLNFSLLCSPQAYSKTEVQELLGRVMNHLGVPWTCNSHGDFFARERKFSGHAYAVKKDRILHHGTLLVQADLLRLKKYLGGLQGISGPGVPSRPSPVINLSEVVPGLTVGRVIQGFGECFDPIPELFIDSKALDQRRQERSSREWTLGMTPDFTWEGPLGPERVVSGRGGDGEWFNPPISHLAEQ